MVALEGTHTSVKLGASWTNAGETDDDATSSPLRWLMHALA